MNILQIVNVSSVYPGNLMESIWSLEKEIRGVVVYLFPQEAKSREWVSSMKKNGSEVYFKSGNIIRNFYMISKICRKHDIDIIHLHFWNIPDCLAIKSSKLVKRNLKSVIHHHNQYHVSDKRINEKIKKWILNGNIQVACGEAVYQELLNSGFAKECVFHVDNGVVFSRLDNREHIKWKGNNVLMFSSYGCEVKGIDIACKAIYELVQEGEMINLIIVSSDKEEEVKEYIKNTLHKFEIPDGIYFMPPRNDIATYYDAATAFLSASRSEGFCLAVLEATYCGCQTIQSRIPQHALDIPECKTFESENVGELKKVILELLHEDKDEAERIHKLQREYVIRHYGVERWSKEMISIYREVEGEE